MKRTFWMKQLPLAVLVAGLVVTVAMAQNGHTAPKQTFSDTTPDRHKKLRDIDDALEELDRSKVDVDHSLENIDLEKLKQDIQNSMQQFQFDQKKMKESIESAMNEKSIDMTKMKEEIQKAQVEMQKAMQELKSEKFGTNGKDAFNTEEIKAEIDKAMKSIDMDKVKAEMQESLSKIDMEKIKAEMDKVKSIDMEKVQAEMEKIKPEIEASISKAHESIDRARKELTQYKTLIDGLDSDGLINKKETYTIEYRNGSLSINGKTQNEEVVRKYQDVLKGHKDFTIRKDKDNFNIHD